ncbi:MAG: hypothetical protein EPO52_11855 [Herbiconiux sp.]|uniref:hypothetical protein n=1 Tax=Herbiconiux sp. TaxID=1871186 RepID=UPI001220181B|nr:hypothetical protein [Herbiconiux sp.]TAJ47552.1 MAG: hypothetical protein EPO52_11855 [Herbiconiux sp.]
MFEWMDLGALEEKIDAREVRARRSRNAPLSLRRVWATVLGFLGTCALVVFLAFYVTGGDLDLVPWFVIGIAVLFVVAWFLTRRSKARTLRRRLRLEHLAERNGLAIGFDADVAPLRLMVRGRGPHGDAFEMGTVLISETTAGGAAKTVERVFLQLGVRGDAGVEQGSAPAELSISEAHLGSLPAAAAGFASAPIGFRYREQGDGATAYLDEPLDLADADSWRRLDAVAGWLMAREPGRPA